MSGSTEDRVEELQRSYLDALVMGDRRGAFALLDHASATGFELGTLYVAVIQPSMREIGRLWQENRLSVAEEHLATAITQAAMVRAFERVFQWEPVGGRTMVAACADTERHEIGLRMVCDLLELRGWQTTYLGASVPVESLVPLLRVRKPHAVGLSAAIAPHVPLLGETIRRIRREIPEDPPLVLVGGRPFSENPDLAARIGADLTAADAVEAVASLERALADR